MELVKYVSRNGIGFHVECKEKYDVDFWSQFNSGLWEPSTFKVFQDYLTNDSVALDVGAECGSTTLFMASICKRVISLEPSKRFYETIKKSLSLNSEIEKKVELINCCLANSDSDYLYGKDSALFNDIHFVQQAGGYLVKGYGIDTISKKYGKINFIKMDIEGGEYLVLPSMTAFIKSEHPTMLISIHPGFLRGGWSNYLDKLTKFIYRFYDNYTIIKAVSSYKYCYDVESRKKISPWSLLTLRFIRGKSGNECQILVSNTEWRSL